MSDIRPEPELKLDYIERNPVVTTVQVAPDLSEHEVRLTYAERGFAHVEGGWPKEVDPTEVEHVLRFRKKVEKDEEVRPYLFCAFPESRHRPFDATYGVQSASTSRHCLLPCMECSQQVLPLQ